MLDDDDAIKRALSREGYSKKTQDSTTNKLKKMDKVLLQSFEKWMNKGILDEISIEGITPQQLILQDNLKVPAAFLFLDWLKRDPDGAKKSLHVKEFNNSAATWGKKKINDQKFR